MHTGELRIPDAPLSYPLEAGKKIKNFGVVLFAK
jgi:hypothetical protein